jgi:homoserine dehydrogenase
MHTLAILGLGGVGRAVLEQAEPHFKIGLLVDRSGYLAGDLDSATLRRASAAKASGAALASLPEGSAGDWRAALPPRALIADTSADETAASLIPLLDRGHRVVLANKKPLCGPLSQFRALTAAGHTRYEATVGAGLPVVVTTTLLRDSGDTVERIEGCLSGTLGFLLSQIEAKHLFSATVIEAKRRGWTEPDPRDDLGGVDVARKALILGRTLGYAWELGDIQVEPLYPAAMNALSIAEFLAEIAELDPALTERQAAAVSRGCTLRYVATITPAGASVGLREVERDSPLGTLRGPDNMVAWTTARYHERPMVVRGPGAGVEVTASAVLFDLLAFG